MPDMDGAELLKQIKSVMNKIPVNIIAGYPGSKMMERAFKQESFGVMDKPFNASDIVAALNGFLYATQA